MRLKKALLVVVGCLSLALGTIGAVLPILPTVPFLMLSAFCFAKSSEKLHSWFISTKLYKKNLESFVKGEGMTVKIMSTVTILMAIGFIMMSRVPVGRVILAIVWVCHVVYFVFRVKTLKVESFPESE